MCPPYEKSSEISIQHKYEFSPSLTYSNVHLLFLNRYCHSEVVSVLHLIGSSPPLLMALYTPQSAFA